MTDGRDSDPPTVTAPPEISAPEVAATAVPGFWASVAEALRGSRQDFTEGSVARAVLLLAVPMVLEMALESVFAVTDVFFVGRLGADAVATVGLTESVLALMYAAAAGLAVGATALVARRVGEHDRAGAGDAAMQAVLLGGLAALALGTLGALGAPRILRLMGAPASVLATGTGYARIMLGGSGTVLLLFLLNAIFRGAGDAAIAMRVLWLANSINILLGPCLIFGLGPFPRLGVAGAALATTIGRGTGVAVALATLARRGGRVSIRHRRVAIAPSVMGRMVRLSFAGALQALIGTASWVGCMRIAATFGAEVLAGYTIGMRIVVFAILPSWGLSNAAATLVGQALGASRPERGERAVWLTGFYDCCVLGALGVMFVLAAHPIVGVFSSDPAVVQVGANCLRIIAAGFPFYAYGMVVTNAFNGAGDTWTPTVINLFIFWVWEIPLAYALAITAGIGPRGIFTAIAVAFSTLAVVSALLFRRGRWKRVRV